MYASGRTNTQLNVPAILGWILNAVLYAVVLCMLYFYAISFEAWDLDSMGTSIFTGMVFALTFKIMFMMQYWVRLGVFGIALSLGGYLLAIWGYNMTDYFIGVVDYVYSTSLFWNFSIFMIPVTAVLIDVVWFSLKMTLQPSMEQIHRERDRLFRSQGAGLGLCESTTINIPALVQRSTPSV